MTDRPLLNRWIAATDGSCIVGDPDQAGWAWAVSKDPVLFISNWNAGGMGDATSYQAELRALVELLRFIPEDQPVEVRMDAKNVLRAATRLRHRWRRLGWRRSQLGDLAHVDLLKEMDTLLEGRDIQFKWVPAHQPKPIADPLNSFVDRAARTAARTQRSPAQKNMVAAQN